MKLQGILIGSAVVATLGGWFWYQRNLSSEREALRQAVLALDQRHQTELEQLRQLESETRLTRLLAMAATEQATIQLPPPSGGSDPPTPSVDRAEPIAAETDTSGSLTLDAVASHMESTFEAEAVEGRPSAEATTKVQDAIRPLLGERSTVQSVECRSSMCRLKCVQQDEQHYRQFALDVAHSEICKECFFMKSGETADGAWVMTMYMAREGANLPRAE